MNPSLNSSTESSSSLNPTAKEFVPNDKNNNNNASESKGAIKKRFPNGRSSSYQPRSRNYNSRNQYENNQPRHYDRENTTKSSHYHHNNYNNNYGNHNKNRHYRNYNNNNNYNSKNHRSNFSYDQYDSRAKDTKQNVAVERKREEPVVEISQREKLIQEIEKGTLECMICCEFIRSHQPSWSCNSCFLILHLTCVKKWSISSKSEDGWRCVACQAVTDSIPTEYYCFCRKTKNPTLNRYDLPHSCGEVCARKENCPHPCPLLCHPGRCATNCQAFVERSCGCQKTTKTFSCSHKVPFLCDGVCEKLLNCSVHKCVEKCHLDVCQECTEMTHIECYCGKEKKEVLCNEENNLIKYFSCKNVCNKLLPCGNHRCKKTCHDDLCGICSLSPAVVVTCPCGKLPISKDLRSSCLDPIPTCKSICGKALKCGPLSQPHTCLLRCHLGGCSACNKITTVKCRCGRTEEQIKCKNLSEDKDIRCKKKCTKFRSCGKHKCNLQCCIDLNHICNLQCNRILSCGRHKCDKKCHIGNCPTCLRVSFDELYCRCGAEVIYPPVACGTKPPFCNRPCDREHNCDHTVLHNCHSDETCPPCVILTTKFCFGKHEQRKTIPCNQDSFSCGMPCNKALACGNHNCIRPCHENECMKTNEICKQKCTKLRAECGHICSASCHTGTCPENPCREKVEVQCECGNLKTMRTCQEFMSDYRKILTFRLQEQIDKVQQGGNDVDLKDLYGNASKKDFKTLECNESCKLLQRNRLLDIAFKVENPNLISYPKFQPNYSEFIRSFYKKDSAFVNGIFEKLTELVKLAKESKQQRSYSFPVMNRDKRRLIHEMAEMFGVETQAYDKEPHRNIVASATKETCWLPSMSLQEVVQREQGLRKVPAPTHNAWVQKK